MAYHARVATDVTQTRRGNPAPVLPRPPDPEAGGAVARCGSVRREHG